jgi:hypothetical protein
MKLTEGSSNLPVRTDRGKIDKLSLLCGVDEARMSY